MLEECPTNFRRTCLEEKKHGSHFSTTSNHLVVTVVVTAVLMRLRRGAGTTPGESSGEVMASGSPLRQAHVTERLDSPVILMRHALGHCSALICVTQLCRRIRPPRTPMRTTPRLQATRHVEIANTFGSNRAQSALCFASDANASNLTRSRCMQGAAAVICG